MTALTLEEFVATKTPCDDLAEKFGYGIYVIPGDAPITGFIYADVCIIERYEDGFNVSIFNTEKYTKDLAEAERYLYEEFYLPEIAEVE